MKQKTETITPYKNLWKYCQFKQTTWDTCPQKIIIIEITTVTVVTFQTMKQNFHILENQLCFLLIWKFRTLQECIYQ